MNIGLCGGTFDPFHRGHLDPILSARRTMQWDRVVYIPAWRQPFKLEHDGASPWSRFAMTVLATQDVDFADVSPVELERGTVSYTVDTLREFRGATGDAKLDWIIGDDNLARLLEWKSIETILELANFAVLTRNGGDDLPAALRPRVAAAADRPKCGAIVFVHNPTVPVSSTAIRARVRAGQSIDDLVDSRVARYIHHYGLYSKGQP